jgi:hypothetical protein
MSFIYSSLVNHGVAVQGGEVIPACGFQDSAGSGSRLGQQFNHVLPAVAQRELMLFPFRLGANLPFPALQIRH